MTKARVARRIAMAAAYGGGGLGVLSAGAFGLVRAEAALARRAIGEPTGEPPHGRRRRTARTTPASRCSC